MSLGKTRSVSRCSAQQARRSPVITVRTGHGETTWTASSAIRVDAANGMNNCRQHDDDTVEEISVDSGEAGGKNTNADETDGHRADESARDASNTA